MKEKYKEKFKSAGGKVKSTAKRIGSRTKQSFKTTLFNLQYRMDQHIKISKFEEDVERLKEEKAERAKDHFQKITSLEANITLLKIERAELRTNIAAMEKALERMSSNLINTKADLIILKKEYGIE